MILRANALALPLRDESVDSIVTDPPYELGFMGKKWDSSGVAYRVDVWAEALRVLKPGGHLLAFGGSRTYHRMACAIEDAGFEIRDQIQWIYGSGFPKSLDVSKAIDKAAGIKREVVGVNENGSGPHRIKLDNHGKGDTGIGYMDGSGKVFGITAPSTDAAKQWQGWGTALKPAHEPVVVARKPLIGTVAANVLAHGTGALNIDGCRVEGKPRTTHLDGNHTGNSSAAAIFPMPNIKTNEPLGRWPANVIHDGSEEVAGLFPKTGPSPSTYIRATDSFGTNVAGHEFVGQRAGTATLNYGDSGSAARFFYCAKASKADRDGGLEEIEEKDASDRHAYKGLPDLRMTREQERKPARNHHPTVKPLDLMRYLCRLVTPPGGIVLDPFAGSGSTGKAAIAEGFRFIGIELDADYCRIARGRMNLLTAGLPFRAEGACGL